MRDSSGFKARFKSYKEGKPVKEIYDGGYIKEPVITPDKQYNEYINSLPDNQRLTPESSYRSHRYWELNGKPKNFAEAIGKGMFTYDFTDNGWHAKSVALNENTGEYEFMKPNWHDTKMYEDAWYYSKEGEQFRQQYTKKAGAAYDKYIPKYKNGRLPKYEDGTAWYDQLNNSFLGTVVKAADPTGVSSWYDVAKAYDDYRQDNSASNLGALALEALGAIPIIGKTGKAFKAGYKLSAALKQQKLARTIAQRKVTEDAIYRATADIQRVDPKYIYGAFGARAASVGKDIYDTK